jgi:hypothetical protein
MGFRRAWPVWDAALVHNGLAAGGFPRHLKHRRTMAAKTQKPNPIFKKS